MCYCVMLVTVVGPLQTILGSTKLADPIPSSPIVAMRKKGTVVVKDLPLDRLGRVLPPPSWPPERNAPDDLELLRRFCNTVNRENGADRLDYAEDLDAWLLTEHEKPVSATRSELQKLRTFRERLFVTLLGAARSADGPSAIDVAAVAEALETVKAHVAASGATLRLSGAAKSPAALLLTRLALILVRAQEGGRWLRLKPCAQCEWVIYDTSKNSSARWCSMSACGGRENARAYRRRQREAAGPRRAIRQLSR